MKPYNYILCLLAAITFFFAQKSHGQVNETEKTYLTLLSVKFGNSKMTLNSDAGFWSQCLGEQTILINAELNKRISNLITDNEARTAFYRRMNFYLSETTSYYTEMLTLYKGNIRVADKEVLPRENMKVYIDHIISFGQDPKLKLNCTATDSTGNKDASGNEIRPEFPGGEIAMRRFIGEKLNYPAFERDNDIQGKVVIKFIVCENGELANIETTYSPTANLAAAAMRVIKMMPNFTPAKKDGKPVAVKFALNVNFRLQ